jgi:hypothetical protein
MNNDDISELKAEIARLNSKIKVMRGLLWEWNPSYGQVWEHPRLKQVGEKKEDYGFIDDSYEPLYDHYDN